MLAHSILDASGLRLADVVTMMGAGFEAGRRVCVSGEYSESIGVVGSPVLAESRILSHRVRVLGEVSDSESVGVVGSPVSAESRIPSHRVCVLGEDSESESVEVLGSPVPAESRIPSHRVCVLGEDSGSVGVVGPSVSAESRMLGHSVGHSACGEGSVSDHVSDVNFNHGWRPPRSSYSLS